MYASFHFSSPIICSVLLLISFDSVAQKNVSIPLAPENSVYWLLKSVPDSTRFKLFKNISYCLEILDGKNVNVRKRFCDTVVRSFSTDILGFDSLVITRSLRLELRQPLSYANIRFYSAYEKDILLKLIENDVTLNKSNLGSQKILSLSNDHTESNLTVGTFKSKPSGAQLYIIPYGRWDNDDEFKKITQSDLSPQVIDRLRQKSYINNSLQTDIATPLRKDYVFVIIAEKDGKYRLLYPYSVKAAPEHQFNF